MNDFLDMPEDDLDRDLEEVEYIIRRQKRLSRTQMIAEDERRRKTRILDFLLCKIKSKLPDELFGLLTASPDQNLDRPQDIRLDAKGRTALHYIADLDAVSYNKDPSEFTFITEEVLAAGIDPNILDASGKTAEEYCKCEYLKQLFGDLK